MITLTIVVPTYKRPELLRRCLESVYAGGRSDIQVVVVDDDPDCCGFAPARDFPCNYVAKRGIRRGLARSRNLGLLLAEGRYIAFIDDDDYFTPEGIPAIYEAIAEAPDFVFFDHTLFDGGHFTQVGTEQTTPNRLMIGNTLPVGSYVISRGLIRHPFDEHLASHEDWNFLLDNLAGITPVHKAVSVVVIDKTENLTNSHQAATRQNWWLDYLAIYARHPAPELNVARAEVLKCMGILIPDGLLTNTRYLP